MSPLDAPTALAVLAACGFLTLAWAWWVACDVAQARRARRRASIPSRVQPPPACHVTGCPVPGYVPVHATGPQGWRMLHVCHGHADEGTAYGWWHRAEVAA